MANGRIDENGLPVYAPGDYDFVRVVDRSTGASRNALAPDVTTAARELSDALGQVVADAEADIAPVIAGLGYLPPVPYASGLTVDSTRFTVIRDGQVYAPADPLPFTTGAWNASQWRLVQGVVATDLMADTGAAMVAVRQPGPSTYARTVAAELLDRVSILRFIPPALHAGIRNGGGTTDLRAYVQNAVDHCIQNGRELYCPAGVYVIDVAPTSGGTLLPIYLSNLTAHGQGLVMTGEGRGKTIFREQAGATARGGRFTKMFYYNMAANTFRAGSFSFRGITFDKNGRSNGPPPTRFEWEQAHIFSWAGDPGTPSIDAISFRECALVDKVGAGINLSSSATKLRSLVVDDLQSPPENHPNTELNDGHYGDRGCLEFGIDSEMVVVSATVAQYCQIEPVVASSSTRRRYSRISQSQIDWLEFSDSGGYSFVDVTNVSCPGKLFVSGVDGNVIGCRFRVPPTGDVYAGGVLRFSRCKIVLPYNATTGAVTPMTTGRNAANPGAFDHALTECEFAIDAVSTPVTPTGSALSGGTNIEMGGGIRRVTGCNFDTRVAQSIDAYRNGDWVIDSCKLAGSVRAIDTGGFSTFGGRVIVRDCDFSAATGPSIRLNRNNDLWEFQLHGTYPTSQFSWAVTGSSGDLDVQVKALPDFVGTAAPSGFWPRGCYVRNRLPAASGVMGWVKTASDSTSGTWKAFGSVAS